MAAYCTVQDLIDRYGETEIMEITDRDQTGAVDETVAGRAIDDASAEVDGYIGSRYDLPLASPPAVLTRITADIARYRLYDNMATEEVRKRYEDALRFLKSVGKAEISLGAAEPPASTGSPMVDRGRRLFDDDGLEGF